MARSDGIPQLAAPGAGLPWTQAVFGRYLLLPFIARTHSWARAGRVFQHEGRRALALAEPLSATELATRVLVRGVIGIEDSSRFWSVALALEHLIIVGDTMADILIALSHGRPPTAHVDIAGVKPPGRLPPADAIPAFREYLARYARRTTEEIGDPRSPRRLDHPWFGEITAHQWHCLAGLHQRIHRRQLEAIVRGLTRL